VSQLSHPAREPAIRSLKAYPKYKDSGIEWLGEIPEHWDVMMLKRLATLQAGYAITAERIHAAGNYPVFGGNGSRGFTDSFTHEGVLPLIGRQGALCGCINLAAGRFWASEHAIVAQPGRSVDALWLSRLLEAMALNTYAQSAAQPGIAVETISAVRAPYPPIDEQQTIAAFLDRDTARIDKLVAKKKRLIELLREQLTVLISRAVTNGLDPSVPMTDSGVEWFGRIPAHWQAKKIKRLFHQTKRQGYPEQTVLSVYRDFGVIEKSSRDDNSNRTPEDLDAYQLVKPNDLVINKMKAWQGSLGVAPVTGITSPDYVVFSPTHSENHRFVHHFLRNRLLTRVYLAMSNGIRPSQWRLEPERFAELFVFVPPREEQDRIAAFIDRNVARIESLVSRVNNAIDRLEEFRTALICAAVTGKIDVRETAA
jgi:type I restriction enzyme, S subunit